MVAVRTCSRCGEDFEREALGRLCDRCRLPADRHLQGPHPGDPLTNREKHVVALTATGRANKEIAADLRLSEGTVKTYLSRIFVKMRVSNRTELAIHVLKGNLAKDALLLAVVAVSLCAQVRFNGVPVQTVNSVSPVGKSCTSPASIVGPDGVSYFCSGGVFVAFSGGAVPSGAIILITSGTCPTGFAEVSALNGKTVIERSPPTGM